MGIDPVASAMAEASRRAAAKPARGGVANAMFPQAALENLPGPLAGLATAITVNYPWGSLLRAVVLPDEALLANLAALAAPGASLDVIVNMHPLRDAAYAGRLGLADAAILKGEAELRAAYSRSGFDLRAMSDIIGTLPHATRWGSQLHHAGREVWRVTARRL